MAIKLGGGSLQLELTEGAQSVTVIVPLAKYPTECKSLHDFPALLAKAIEPLMSALANDADAKKQAASDAAKIGELVNKLHALQASHEIQNAQPAPVQPPVKSKRFGSSKD